MMTSSKLLSQEMREKLGCMRMTSVMEKNGTLYNAELQLEAVYNRGHRKKATGSQYYPHY